MTEGKTILDMCCGSRMFWFDRTDPRVMFCDIRKENHITGIRPDTRIKRCFGKNEKFHSGNFKAKARETRLLELMRAVRK